MTEHFVFMAPGTTSWTSSKMVHFFFLTVSLSLFCEARWVLWWVAREQEVRAVASEWNKHHISWNENMWCAGADGDRSDSTCSNTAWNVSCCWIGAKKLLLMQAQMTWAWVRFKSEEFCSVQSSSHILTLCRCLAMIKVSLPVLADFSFYVMFRKHICARCSHWRGLCLKQTVIELRTKRSGHCGPQHTHRVDKTLCFGLYNLHWCQCWSCWGTQDQGCVCVF